VAVEGRKRGGWGKREGVNLDGEKNLGSCDIRGRSPGEKKTTTLSRRGSGGRRWTRFGSPYREEKAPATRKRAAPGQQIDALRASREGKSVWFSEEAGERAADS